MSQNISNPSFLIQDLAASRPDDIAILYSDSTLTFEQLWKVAQTFAIKLRDHGVGPSSIVSVRSQDPTAIIAMVLGAALLGTTITTARPVEIALADLQATHAFWFGEDDTDPDIDDGVEHTEITLDWSPHLVLPRTNEVSKFLGNASPDARFMLLHTSGSTGYPKFLELTYKMTFDRCFASPDLFVAGETIFASLFSAMSQPYLSRALAALTQGCTVISGTDPVFFREAGANLVFLSPRQVNGAFDTLTDGGKLPAVHIAGGELSSQQFDYLSKHFETIVDVYGATEVGRCFQKTLSRSESGQIEYCPKILGSEIQIVDAAHALVSPGDVGALRIRNGYTVKGYLNDEEAIKSTFHDGWFYPGDVGYFDVGGSLHIIGRIDHVINLGGTKINGFRVDREIWATDGISDAICFPHPKPGHEGELLAFAVFDGSKNQLQAAETAKYNCQKVLGPSATPTHVHPIDVIPRTNTGAPDRQICQKIVMERVA